MRISRISKVAILATATVVALVPSAVAYDVTGTGASSVLNFIDKCKVSYQNDTKDTFSYTGPGSGDGKTAINAGTKDIGYSDSVNTAATEGRFHIPAAVWPISIAYNLNNSASKPLQLSIDTIAKIFTGKITRWNDAAIVADNSRVRSIPVFKVQNGKTVLDANGSPVVEKYRTLTIPFTLPDKPITVIYRTGSSGTTDNFTQALAAGASTVWTKAGNGTFSTANPTDISTLAGSFQGFSGSTGVATAAAAQKYSITYVEGSYVTANPALKSALVINKAGKTTSPDVPGAQAMYAASDLNEATGIVTWKYATTAPAAYPFTAATYALVRSNYGDKDKSAAVKRQVEYMAFDCIKTVTTEPMIAISKTSDLGKAILKLTAKIA